MPKAPPVTVFLEREDETIIWERLTSAHQLLNRLRLGVNDALIIRDKILLTPDQKIFPGEHITVRTVISKG